MLSMICDVIMCRHPIWFFIFIAIRHFKYIQICLFYYYCIQATDAFAEGLTRRFKGIYFLLLAHTSLPALSCKLIASTPPSDVYRFIVVAGHRSSSASYMRRLWSSHYLFPVHWPSSRFRNELLSRVKSTGNAEFLVTRHASKRFRLFPFFLFVFISAPLHC